LLIHYHKEHKWYSGENFCNVTLTVKTEDDDDDDDDTETCDRMIRNPASYAGDSGFEFGPETSYSKFLRSFSHFSHEEYRWSQRAINYTST
jgi:hypothetical protein